MGRDQSPERSWFWHCDRYCRRALSLLGLVKPDADGHFPYKNEIPREIVDIFEKHGFIWGGKWYHYDTMHFEYRPELTATPK